MNVAKCLLIIVIMIAIVDHIAYGQASPDEISFVRQSVKRMIFDEDQSIPLASLHPEKIVGLEAMHPITHYAEVRAKVNINENKLIIQSEQETQTGIWFGGFNPFTTF